MHHLQKNFIKNCDLQSVKASQTTHKQRINANFIYQIYLESIVNNILCTFCELELHGDEQYCPECGMWLVQETTIHY
jgi:hypothetical protein